jgi:hypothetical protein
MIALKVKAKRLEVHVLNKDHRRRNEVEKNTQRVAYTHVRRHTEKPTSNTVTLSNLFHGDGFSPGKENHAIHQTLVHFSQV